MSLSLGLSIPALSARGAVRPAWSPAALFEGAGGVWLEAGAEDAAWQDAAGAVPAAPGDPVGRLDDLSGGGRHATQSDPAARPSLAQGGDARWLAFDEVDDTLVIDVPAGGWTGTMVLGTTEAVIEAEVVLEAGPWSVAIRNSGVPGATLIGLVLADGAVGGATRDLLRAHMLARGSGNGFEGRADLTDLLRDHDEITVLHAQEWTLADATSLSFGCFGMDRLERLHAARWNTSGVTSTRSLFSRCGSLTDPGCEGWDMSSVTDARFMFYACDSLSALDLSGWRMESCATIEGMFNQSRTLSQLDVTGWILPPDCDCRDAWKACALDQASVDGILAMLDSSGLTGRAVGLGGGTNAAPSATGEAAIDALRGRGCTVSVNGGY